MSLRRNNQVAQPLLEQEVRVQVETPTEKYTNKLNRYIGRIERHKTPDGNPDFKYGFWVAADSRAANREANYNLACQIRRELAVLVRMMGVVQREMVMDVMFTKGNHRKAVIDRNAAIEQAMQSFLIVSIIKELFSQLSITTERKVPSPGPDRGINSRELNNIIREARSEYVRRFFMFNNEEIDVEAVGGGNSNDIREMVDEIRNRK